jgi:3-oxocholest-4-en-26-oyl-CoA dehydrogenase alpha subunit
VDFAWPQEYLDARERTRAVLERAWPQELRRYAMNDSVSRDVDGAEPTLEGVDHARIRQLWAALAEADLFRIGVPERFGGVGGGAFARYAVQSEVAGSGAPFPYVASGIVVPTLLHTQSEALIERFMPPILAGEIEFAIGYTEPAAGTDLANLRTSATRNGNGEFLVRGQKVYTSGAHFSEYLWTAVRTDPDAAPHRGISLLIIPMASPGITVTPLRTISGTRTNIVFLEDVHVSAENLVGEANHGWRYLTHALAHERYTALLATPVVEAYRQAAALVADDEGIAHDLARLRARTRVTTLLSAQAAWLASLDRPLVAEAALGKIVTTELRHDLAAFTVGALGASGLLTEEAAGPPALGQFERMLRHSWVTLFGAGANDVQRDLIARTALGLRRSA